MITVEIETMGARQRNFSSLVLISAEFGDCMEADETEVRAFLQGCQLLPKQNDALEQQIMEHHREHL